MLLYKQIEQDIETEILTGKLKAGDKLPSEKKLGERFGVSKTTLRMAIAQLKHRGFVYTEPSKGIYVRKQEKTEKIIAGKITTLTGFSAELKKIGIEPDTRVLKKEVVENRFLASLFNIPVTSKFLRLHRIRRGKGIGPIGLEKAYYNLLAMPDLNKHVDGTSIYHILQYKYHFVLHGTQNIETHLPSTREQLLLEIPREQPCLLIKRKTYNQNNVMIEYVEALFRGDKYILSLKV